MFVIIKYCILLGSSTVEPKNRYVCPRNCGRTYKWKSYLNTYLRFECGIHPQFQCPYCSKLVNGSLI